MAILTYFSKTQGTGAFPDFFFLALIFPFLNHTVHIYKDGIKDSWL